jgi:hypothetical protein
MRGAAVTFAAFPGQTFANRHPRFALGTVAHRLALAHEPDRFAVGGSFLAIGFAGGPLPVRWLGSLRRCFG